MKKKIGNALALYPTPLVVVGAMVDGRPRRLRQRQQRGQIHAV